MTETPGGPRLRRAICALGRLPAALAHHFREDSRSTLFSAALAVIAAHVGALGILAKLSLIIVANLASQSTPVLDGRGPVVLLMGETHWQQRYFEHSPLDRCTMADDLGAILSHAPRTVAIDFDLSPSLRPTDAACQTTLDALLDRNATRLVLLSPIKVNTATVIEQKRKWMLDRCNAGGVFADGGLELSLGMVIDATPGNDRMAEVVRQRSGSTICSSLANQSGVAKWLERRSDDAAPADDGHSLAGAVDGAGHVEPVAVNFAHFRNSVHKIGIEQLATSAITDWPQRDVFFGGDYGSAKEDRFSTPIGPLPGIAVHAARRVTLDHPVAELQPVAGFAADIMIAFVFSLGIAAFWSRYAHFRISQYVARRQVASLMVVGFVFFYTVLVFLFFQLGTDFFAVGILIAPLVIAVSMLVDGFITGPIAAVLKLMQHEPEKPLNRGEFAALIVILSGLALFLAMVPTHPLSLAGVPVVVVAALADYFVTPVLAGQRWQRHPPAVTPLRAAVLSLLVVGAGFAITAGLLRTRTVAFSHLYTQAFFTALVCITAALAVGIVYPLGPGHRPAPSAAAPPHLLRDERGPDTSSAPSAALRTLASSVAGLKKLIFWGAVFVALNFLIHHS